MKYANIKKVIDTLTNTEKVIEVRGFDAVDTKGRQIGAKAISFTKFCDQFAFYPEGQRGGESYGASQRTQIFASAAERDAAVQKYFINAEKRALKTWGIK